MKSLLKKKLFFLVVGFVCWSLLYITGSFKEIELPQPDKKPLLYANQLHDNLKNGYLSAIKSAKESIVLIIYSLSDPDIIHALQAAGERGVAVKVICDGNATYKKLGKAIDVKKIYKKGLMHQKILVIDSKQIWLGSANMTEESLLLHGNLVTAFYSPEMARFINDKSQASHTFLVANQRIDLSFLPEDVLGAKKIVDLIRSAKKTIKVAMFTFTREDFTDELIKAKNRGVDVQVVIDRRAALGAGVKVYQKLLENHLNPILSEGDGLLHHKFLYIDDTILVNGSANWTKAAFNKNDDCFLILYDLTQEQQDVMNRLWKVIPSLPNF